MTYLWILLFVMKLHVVENTIFGHCDDHHFAGRNIALGQETEQSGDYSNQISSKAVDGADPTFEQGTCAHSLPRNGTSWWLRNRLKNFEVTGFVEGLQEGRTLYNDSKLQQYNKSIIRLRIDKNDTVKFKSVMISVPRNFNKAVEYGNSMVTVCEVEIYTPISTEQVGGEVTDTNKFEVYIIVGAMSGVGGAVIATMVLLTIWIDKCRRNREGKRYIKLRKVKRNDYIMSDNQDEQYEMVV